MHMVLKQIDPYLHLTSVRINTLLDYTIILLSNLHNCLYQRLFTAVKILTFFYIFNLTWPLEHQKTF